MNRLERPLAIGNVSNRLPGFRLSMAGMIACGWLAWAASAFAEGPYPTTPPSAETPPTNRVVRPNGAPSSQSEASPKTATLSTTTEIPSSAARSSGVPAQFPNVKPLECGQIVAWVDGQVVLSCDVLWQVNIILEQNRDKIPPGEYESVRKMLMRQQVLGLIDTKLLFADFRRTVPEEGLAKIKENLEQPFEEHEIPRLMKMLEVNDRRSLAELLNKYDSSIREVKRLFVERTVAGEWLKQRIPKPKPVTHEQMLEHYQEHLKDYEYPSQVQWEELMVRLDRFGGDRSKAWQAIAGMGNDVWWQVSQEPNARGAVFEKIAKARSHGFTARNGGRHDWTTIDSLRCQAINDALFSLEVGQMSNILESERGFHIVRVLRRKKAGRTPFTDAQASIRERLEEEQLKDMVTKEIAEIRKSSRVWTVFDGYLGAEKLSQVLGGGRKR